MAAGAPRGRRHGNRAIVVLVAIAYLAALLTLTFLPLTTRHAVDVNLVPFHTIRYELSRGLGSYPFALLLGNLAAFLPVGALVPLLARRRSLLLVIASAFVLSAAIELGQLAVSRAVGYTYRSADIDDVIVNVTGAVLGYLAFRLLWRGGLAKISKPA